jgi:tol-pal system-associated acyl-CoA thioesterase
MTEIQKTIYYHDTDAGGVVYYANYLKYMEEARTAFLNDKGISIKELHHDGFLYAVRQCSLKYKQPARYGDEIIVSAAITKMTAAQIFFDQKVILAKTGAVLVEAEMVLVNLDKNFKAAPIPDGIRNRLSA